LEKNGTIETLIHFSAYITFCLKFACILKKFLFPPNRVCIKKKIRMKKPKLVDKNDQFFKNRKKKKFKKTKNHDKTI